MPRREADFEFGSSHPATVTSRARVPWRRLIVAVLAAALVAAGAAYVYVYERPLAERVLKDTPVRLPASVTEVYKWRDPAGHWHITDEPPAPGVSYETLRYSSDTNVMPVAPRE